MPRISHGRLSDLIGIIYDCAIDPDLWPKALTMLLDQTRFANTMLSAIAMPSGEILLNVAVGLAPDYLESMNDYAADVVEMWGGVEAVASYPHVTAALAELRGITLSMDGDAANSQGRVNTDVIVLSQRFAQLMAEYNLSISDGVISINEAKRMLRETLALQKILIEMKLHLEQETT